MVDTVGSLMDTNVPSQLDEEDLKAEIELEIPSTDEPLLTDPDIEIEITEEDEARDMFRKPRGIASLTV